MKKEYLTEMLANRVVKAPVDRRLHFLPRDEQLREPSVTVRFSVCARNVRLEGCVMI